MPRYGAEIKQRIIELYQTGVGGYRVAKEVGVSHTTVMRIVHQENLIPKKNRKNFSLDIEKQIVEEYIAGATRKALAEKYECCTWTIRSIVRRQGGQIRPPDKLRRVFSEDEKDQIIRMWKEGWRQTKIARHFKTSQVHISRMLRRAGHWNDTHARGERHGHWKGGRLPTSEGYVIVRVEQGEPFACMATQTGYVLEHRLVMAKHLGRPLDWGETVHHMNGNRADNRIENLQLRQGQHGKGQKFVCADCGSNNVTAAEI